MVDFAMDVHKSLYPDKEVPASLREKRTQVVENFKTLKAETDPVLKIFVDPEVTRQIQSARGDAKQLLDFLRILVQPTDKNYLNGMWGKLASEILMQNWE